MSERPSVDGSVVLPQFAVAVRGYDRRQVDEYVGRLTTDLDEAHARAVAAERQVRTGTGGSGTGTAQAAETARAARARAEALVQEAERNAAEIRAAAQQDARQTRERAERQVEALLAAAAAAGPADAPAASTPARTGPEDEPPSYPPVRLPLAGLAPVAGGRRPTKEPSDRPAGRRRSARLAGAGVAALAALGAGAVVVHQVGRDASSGPAAAQAPGTQVPTAGAVPTAEAVPTVQAVAAGVEQRRATAGPAGPALLGALRRLGALRGLERRARALSLASDVEHAVARGELTPQVQGLVRPTLLHETAAQDVRDLGALLAVRPAAAGSAGPATLGRLRALQDAPSSAAARALRADVQTQAQRGALTTAFRDVAVPVLDRAVQR